MATTVSPPFPSSKGLCISVLFRLGKCAVCLEQDAAFIGSAATGARECEGGPRHDETRTDGKAHVANGSKGK